MLKEILKSLFLFVLFTFLLHSKSMVFEHTAMASFEEDGEPKVVYSNLAVLEKENIEKVSKQKAIEQELFVRFASSSKSLVGIGDFVKLTLKVDNTGSSDSLNTKLKLTLPAGTRYVKDSFKIVNDSSRLNEPELSSSLAIFTLNDMAKESSQELSFVLQIGVGASNEIAFLATAIADNLNSNQATETLSVENKELMIGKSTLIGSVRLGDKPVENVRIYMEDGTFTLTDTEGKYHFEGIDAGTHVVQLDTDSLSENHLPGSCGDNVRFAGSKVSQFVEMFSGTLHRTDFCLEEKNKKIIKKDENNSLKQDTLMEKTLEKYSKVSESSFNFNFASLSSELDVDAKRELQKSLREVSVEDIDKIIITGHSDNQKIRVRKIMKFKDNYELSLARAKNVKKFLVEALKMNAQKITVRSKGESEPIASNKTKKGRALNRRIELSLFVKKQVQKSVLKKLETKKEVSIEAKETSEEVMRFMIDDAPEVMPNYNANTLKKMNDKTEWVWPTKEFVPSVGAVNLVVKHEKNQTVSYEVNDEAIDLIHLEKVLKSAKKAMTFYKGVHLRTGDNKVVAIVKNADKEVKRLERNIHFSSMPVRAKVIKALSYLIADGKQTPVVAVKFFDKDGYPVRGDVIGKYKISQPYKGYRRLDELGQNPLSQSTTGEDYVIASKGMAYIKLEPTTKAGEAILSLPFLDRTEELKVWLKPKVRDWILVGFAKGSVGHKRVSKGLEKSAFEHDEQLSVFAKGKVLGSYLLTASYNNKKGNKELLDVIEPNRYYTVYGDKSERGVEAASVKKLYLKLEKDDFYGMFGDYVTGFNDMELSKYNRTLNGAKGEYHSEHLDVQAFGSDSDQSFVKDEIPGDGTSGLYRLSNKNIIVNSEKVSIETRDRFQSDNVLNIEKMTALVDYTIDYFNGTIFFKKPIFSQDSSFNPITIVVDYEVQANGESKTMGARVALKVLDEKVQVASTYIKEDMGVENAQLAALDVRAKIGDEGILEVEYAQSEKSDIDGKNSGIRAEYEHNGKDVYTKAYYSKIDEEFGLKQQSASETNREKYGVETRYKPSEKLEATGKIYRDKTLSSALVSDVAEGLIEYRDDSYYTQGGYRYISDSEGSGQQLIAGVGKSLFDQRVMLRGRAERNVDASTVNRYPDRTILGVDFKVTDQNILFVEHEIEESVEKRTLSRVGVRSEPWSGGQVQSSVNRELNDAGRVFSEVGIQQTVKLTDHLNVDFGLDQSQTMSGSNGDSNISEDFTSYSSSINYHEDGLSSSVKAELKKTDSVDTMSLATALLTEFDSDLELMVGAQYMASSNDDHVIATNLSVAYRPTDSDYAVLNKLQYISEKVSTIESQKIINDFNLNYKASDAFELSLYQGVKDVTDTIDDEQFRGLVTLSGLRFNYDISEKFDVMLYSNVLYGFDLNQQEFNHGMGLGWNAFHNIYLVAGYNFKGFRDDDFSSGTQTQKGAYLDFMMKFQ